MPLLAEEQIKSRPRVDAVRDAGLVGDGVTDNLSKLPSLLAYTTSPTVYFRPGIYLIGCPAQHSAASDISLIGAGQDVTTLKLSVGCTLSSNNLFLWQSGSTGQTTGTGIRVSGFTLDLNGASRIGSVVSVLGFNGISDGSVDHVSIINGGSGFINLISRVAGSAGSRHFSITDNYLALGASSTNQNQCILTSSAGGGGILGGDVLRNRCIKTAMDISGHALNIRDNEIIGWGYGGGITTEANADTYSLVITGNRSHDSSTTVDPAGGPCIESWAANSIISRNAAYNCATDGIANGGRNTTVSDNVAYGNGKAADGRPYCGVVARHEDSSFTADNSVYIRNRAYDDGSGYQKYGYCDNKGVAHIRLVRNNFDGNAIGRTKILGTDGDDATSG